MKFELHISYSKESNICATCGTRYAAAKSPADACPVCMDDRQYIGDGGQQWTSYEQLSKVYTIRFGKQHDRLLFCFFCTGQEKKADEQGEDWVAHIQLVP